MNYMMLDSDTFANEITTSLNPIDDCNKLEGKIIDIANKLGFSDIDVSIVQGGKDFNFIISSLPGSLHDAYISEEMDKNDYILELLKSSEKPIFDGEVYDFYINTPYITGASLSHLQNPRELLKSYKFYESYTIPFYDRISGGKFLFSLLQRNMSSDKFKKQIKDTNARLNEFAKLTCKILTYRGHISSLLKTKSPESLISNRQIQILDALSTLSIKQKDIPRVIGRCKSTVEKDIRDLKDKFETKSLYRCVHIATKLKLIS